MSKETDGIFEQLRSAIMDILSDGATWETKDIVYHITQQVDDGVLKIRTDNFPSGGKRMPPYTSRALKQLRSENKVVHKSRGLWESNLKHLAGGGVSKYPQ